MHPLLSKPKVRLFAALIAMGVIVPGANAATAPDAVNQTRLQDLIEEAERENPGIRAAQARWQASRKRIGQAWSLPDPSAGFMIMGDDMLETRLGPQEDIYEVEQMVPFPGKLLQRRSVARAEARAAEAAYRAARSDVARDVAAVYYDLYAAEASIRVLEELLQRLTQLEEIAQARYAAQGGSQRDVAKAQTEASMTLERLLLMRQQRDSLAARLNALLNRPPHTPMPALEEPQAPPPAAGVESLMAAAEKARPELAAAASMVERDKHAKRLAYLEYMPDVSVGFRYYAIGNGTTSMPDDGQDAWMVPVMITLPLWQNRIVPAIQEAGRNLQASQSELSEQRNLADYEVQDRYYRLQTAAKVVELYENALIPEAELAFKSDLAGYEAGSQQILDLIDSERTYLNAKVAYHQAVAEYYTSYAELERAVGATLAGLTSEEKQQ